MTCPAERAPSRTATRRDRSTEAPLGGYTGRGPGCPAERAGPGRSLHTSHIDTGATRRVSCPTIWLSLLCRWNLPNASRPHALPGLALCHHNAVLIGEADTGGVPLALPLFASLTSCGFPSPADDFVAAALDLNDLIVANPPATFFVRASGDSMLGAGIDSGDLCVVDRSLEAAFGDIVVAEIDGEFTMKRYARRGGLPCLVPENDAYPVIPLHGDADVRFFGVVTFTVKAQSRRRA